MSPLEKLLAETTLTPLQARLEREAQRLGRELFVKSQCSSPLQKQHLEAMEKKTGSLLEFSMGRHY